MRLVACIALALISVTSCSSDGDRKRTPRQEQPKLPFDGSTARWSSTTGIKASFIGSSGIAIPRCGKGKLGYVTVRWPAPMVGGSMKLTYSLELSPDGKIVGHENRTQSGRIALHFQRQGDDFRQYKYDRGYRQWSYHRPVLIAGEHTIEVPLVHASWNGGGSKKLEHFEAAMKSVKNVGFTLSDNQTAGHGVCMATGTARLSIKQFSVEG